MPKPVEIFTTCHAMSDWRVAVRRDGVVLTRGRGRTEAEAVAEAVKGARAAMRLERDERARLALLGAADRLDAHSADMRRVLDLLGSKAGAL